MLGENGLCCVLLWVPGALWLSDVCLAVVARPPVISADGQKGGKLR